MHPSETPMKLRAAQLRVTAPRVAVLEELSSRPHADADDLVMAVRERLGSVSVQAVYDVLRALTAAGLVRRIEPAGHPARYETRTGDNHHHVVCRSCGAVGDVDCAVGPAPCLEASNPDGFTIDEAEVIYWGHCSECRDDVPGNDESSDPRSSRHPGTPGSQVP
ncbi:Fur family transcriptional regulator [Allobranchiibius huperziae]|nr:MULTISPECIES: Fur family transcriptional regulator [Allobranchiibius]UIJ34202.1 transcriptional repressor [Allobranchiibius sp. GilTou73]